jgi:hypothetical protein
VAYFKVVPERSGGTMNCKLDSCNPDLQVLTQGMWPAFCTTAPDSGQYSDRLYSRERGCFCDGKAFFTH